MQQSWVVVTKTFGIVDAQIIAGRLDAEGIPVRVRPEESGRHFGINVGKLGQVAVEVPELYLESAEAILSVDFSDEDFYDDDLEFDDDDELDS